MSDFDLNIQKQEKYKQNRLKKFTLFCFLFSGSGGQDEGRRLSDMSSIFSFSLHP